MLFHFSEVGVASDSQLSQRRAHLCDGVVVSV